MGQLLGCLVNSDFLSPDGGMEPECIFIRSLIRFSRFETIDVFVAEADCPAFLQHWCSELDQTPASRRVRVFGRHQLPKKLSEFHYTAFHCALKDLPVVAELRALYDGPSFPITCHGSPLLLQFSAQLLQSVLLAPIRSCDLMFGFTWRECRQIAGLFESEAKSLNSRLGGSVSFPGKVERVRYGGSSEASCREGRNRGGDSPVILCMGPVSATTSMDLHPLLLALNDLMEEDDLQFHLVVAGDGDASGEYIKSLIARAYELNLEDRFRLELSPDQNRQQQLLQQASLFVDISDRPSAGPPIQVMAAMQVGLPVVLSDTDAHRSLLGSPVKGGGVVGILGGGGDMVYGPEALLDQQLAELVRSQGSAVDVTALAETLRSLILESGRRHCLGRQASDRVRHCFANTLGIEYYDSMLKKHLGGMERLPAGSIQNEDERISPIYDKSHFFGKNAQWVVTDRGLRVLLQSEHLFQFRRLACIIDKQSLLDLLQKCVRPVAVSSLKRALPGESRLQWMLLWLAKYQLISVTTICSSRRTVPSRIAIDRSLDAGCLRLIGALSFPDDARLRFLVPVVARLLAGCKRWLGGIDRSGGALLSSLGEAVIPWMDDRLLQAMGWYADQQRLSDYEQTVSELTTRGVDLLAVSYPLWSRQSRREYVYQCRFFKQVLTRVERDLSEINRCFFQSSNRQASGLCRLENLKAEKGLPIYRLWFDNGESLVYKPRDMTVEQRLAGLNGGMMADLNLWLGSEEHLGVQRVLSVKGRGGRSGYGYVEYVDQQTPLAVDQLDRLHERLGVMAAFCLFTGLADIHPQNVRVRGSVPFLIDLETAFHSDVLMQLEQEFDNPSLVVVRGVSESALGKSGLTKFWEHFQSWRTGYCSSAVVDGMWNAAEIQTTEQHLDHLMTVGERHSMDGQSPHVAAAYADSLISGFRRAVEAIAANATKWQQQLRIVAEGYVRYQPRWNLAELRKQFRDLHVSSELQQLGGDELERYLFRVARRTALAGEISQRWLDTHWQEPTGRLAAPLAEGWLVAEQREFLRCPLSAKLYQHCYNGVISKCEDDYFSVDCLTVLAGLMERLSDDAVRTSWLDAYGTMLRAWLVGDSRGE